MTDEELERLAHAADYGDDGEAWLLRFQTRNNNDYHTRLMKAVTPRAVLALLERVRKAEAKVADLEKEHEEDQGVIRVWRGRTERAEANVTLLAQQVVDALNDCDHGGGGTPVGCAGCEPMLAALREAGVEVEGVAKTWPYWRLKA